ncbi:MAG: UDP-3-O-(3-hydroxymyristoyl)glucosamine N-acyltransferase [Bacteroidia bacterium]|nr:UDP-3-O-(3-hydroxymyristoyl)glucosamine N-acyltransferase [Bacteroidia bacterium]
MKFTLQTIAALLGADIEGDPGVEIFNVSRIEQGSPGTISFLANPKYIHYIYQTGASAVLVSRDFVPERPVPCALLRVDDPYTAFSLLLEQAQKVLTHKEGIEPNSFIASSAKVGEKVYIGAFAYIGEGAVIGNGAKIYPNAYVGDRAVIGEGSTIFPNVTIYHDCKIGKNCRVHAGSVIGSDGFGFAPQQDGQYRKVPQTGIVILEDEVEIGAGVTIDRATLGETLIKKGTKIDNLVQIAHNVEIGEHSVVAAQTGISGSSKLGNYCMVGGQVGIVGHIELAEGTKIGAQSGVSKSWTQPGTVLRGSPAQELNQQLRSEAVFRKLDQMAKKIAYLEKKLSES